LANTDKYVMDATSIAITALAMQQAVYQSNLQMAMVKQSITSQSQSILQLLEGAAQIASNPAHLGSQVDTLA
jgi:hypothetical protein